MDGRRSARERAGRVISDRGFGAMQGQGFGEGAAARGPPGAGAGGAGPSAPAAAAVQGGSARIMTLPIHLLFRMLQKRTRIAVWLYEKPDIRLEGVPIGFDEYMNIVLDDGHEVSLKTGSKLALGRVLLKGDNVTLVQRADVTT